MTAVDERPDTTAAVELTGIGDDDYIPPLNPVDVETEMSRTRLRIARGVRIVSGRRKTAREAKKAYRRAYAFAFIRTEGPQYLRDQLALTDEKVMAAEDDMEVAQQAYQYALDTAEALREDLSALQSISKSMIAMYGSEHGFGG